MFHIVDGLEAFFQPFLCWCKAAMFFSLDFGIAKSHWLTCPIVFGRGGCKSCNVPLGSIMINIQHQHGICHTMLYEIQ